MTLSIQQFVAKAKTVHGEQYDYSKSSYKNWDTKLVIVCNIHGQFEQKPRQHIERRSGCPKCAKSGRQPTSRTEFINRAKQIHHDRYNYDLMIYSGFTNPIRLICNIHGQFWFKHAYAHVLNKNGCAKCARIEHRLTNNQFIEKSQLLWDSYYTYDNTQYTTTNIIVTITCPQHGEQQITPTDHYRVGCWLCKRNRMQDIWLDELGLPSDKEHRQVRIKAHKLFVVDGYDSKTNTIYLFHGDFWHGNPKLYNSDDINRRVGKTFGELYVKTIQYEQDLRKLGYKVVSVWEQEWLQNTVKYATES